MTISTRFLLRALCLVILMFLSAIGFLMYREHQRYTMETALVPIISPDTKDVRLRPEDPEGMEIPNKDLSVYDHLESEAGKITSNNSVPANPKKSFVADADDIIPKNQAESQNKVEELNDIPFMPASSLKGSLIDLGLFSAREEASQAWGRAKNSISKTDTAIEPQLIRDQNGYHLYIIGFTDVSQANDTCDLLNKIGLSCEVVKNQ